MAGYQNKESYTIGHHGDLIRMASGRESMCDEDDSLGLTRRQSRYLVYRIEYMILGVSVEGRCLRREVTSNITE